VVFFFNAIPTTFLAYMLAQQLTVLGIEDANKKLIPLHLDQASDPAWRQAVVGRLDFAIRRLLLQPSSAASVSNSYPRGPPTQE